MVDSTKGVPPVIRQVFDLADASRRHDRDAFDAALKRWNRQFDRFLDRTPPPTAAELQAEVQKIGEAFVAGVSRLAEREQERREKVLAFLQAGIKRELGKRGRPRKLKWPDPPKTRTILGDSGKKPGAAAKITLAMKRELLAEIDRTKALLRRRRAEAGASIGRRRSITDAYGLYLIMAKYQEQALLAQGTPLSEARRLAKAFATGPRFRSRKVDVSRWRRDRKIQRS
jgi:hypothetical protein